MATQDSDTAGVIARPPLLYAGFFLAGVALDYVWPIDFLRQAPAGWRYAIASVLFLAGLAFFAPAIRAFLRAGTNVPTNLPTTALVIAGPYRLSRNPIYIGLSLAYVALALALAEAWALLLLAPLLVVMRYGVIAREEAYLARKFGEEYRRYTQTVRRWL